MHEDSRGLRRTILVGFLFVVLFSFSSSQPIHDWDWMDCHNGTYWDIYHESIFRCNCTEGYTGVDCSLCADNSVCPKDQVCDKSMLIGGEEKSFNCTPTGQSNLPDLGSMTTQWYFPNASDHNGGYGILTVYVRSTGAPFLFNCTFSDCDLSISSDEKTETITCETSSCHCSSWCNAIVNGIISRMKGTATFQCDVGSGNCTIVQQNMPLTIEVVCQAGGCQQGPYVPPPPRFTTWEMVGIFAGGALGVAVIFGSFAISCTLFHRSKRRHYQLLGHHATLASLSWQNLHCQIKVGSKDRIILNGVSGTALPGQITAIIGPSGAGKTTFLDVLAGRKNTGVVEGEILVNGKPRTKSFKRIAGYVMQDDKMLGTFTVREHLMYIAQLRLPAGMPWEERVRRVESVMEELGISRIANSLIGTDMSRGISGGERRRLSIAVELVTDPSILFLDEPTSGLDSYNAYTLMETLTTLARNKSRTIITTIHQPRSNIYSMFDNVILLAQGELIYYGPSNESLEYFRTISYECPRNYNPADFMIDLVETNPTVTRELAQKYKESHYYTHNLPALLGSQNHEDIPDQNDSEYSSTWPQQVLVLCKRTLLHNIRNPYLLRTQYILTIALAALLGTIFWHLTSDLQGVQDRAGSLFFMIALLSFSSMSSIDTFFFERGIFVRERANGMYSTSAYFVAKTLCDVIPMRVIPPVLMCSITYYMMRLHPGIDHFFVTMAVLVLVSLVSTSMSLAISSVTPSLSMGNLIAIMLLLFYLLFGGFLVNKTSMPVFIGWLKWTSFQSYAFEILMVNELNGLVVLFNPKGYNIVPVDIDGSAFLQQFDMDASRVYMDYGVLGGMIVVYLTFTYIFLRWVNKERR